MSRRRDMSHESNHCDSCHILWNSHRWTCCRISTSPGSFSNISCIYKINLDTILIDHLPLRSQHAWRGSKFLPIPKSSNLFPWAYAMCYCEKLKQLIDKPWPVVSECTVNYAVVRKTICACFEHCLVLCMIKDQIAHDYNIVFRAAVCSQQWCGIGSPEKPDSGDGWWWLIRCVVRYIRTQIINKFCIRIVCGDNIARSI